MVRNSLFATAVAVMAGSALGANYLFPSANPPAGYTPDQVEQYVTFIWDDNAYSGLKGTLISENPATTVQTDAEMGMSWAVRKLCTIAKNPDGSDVSMTFNPTTGQMVEIYNEGGKRVGYEGHVYTTIPFSGNGGPQEYPVAWGREMGEWSGAKSSGEPDKRPNYLQKIYKEAFDAGHEIGNHTVDHMETNSPLPKEFFPNGGEGYDTDLNEGEANEYWEKCGWMKDAGKKITEGAWGHALKLGEAELLNYLDISLEKGNLFAFRAPRLEVNSNLYFALADQGYLYDCGLEEGYEGNRDGTNFLWPYTLDNGTPNGWTQKEWGSPKPLDSMPTGLWQIPVNVMIVPEEIRADVKQYAIKIAEQGEPGSSWYLDSWDDEGKVTGFDFNMFVLFGMTGPQVQKTLEHTLDLRMDNGGNKAPLQVGCHTDYFTPMYDDGPLTGDATYKLALDRNTYTDRIAAFEGFVDYALNTKKAYIVSGKRLIDEIKALQENPEVPVGSVHDFPDVTWNFYQDEVGSSTDAEEISGNSLSATINLGKAEVPVVNGEKDWDNGKYPGSSFSTYFEKGKLTGLDHISFNYQSNTPLVMRLHMDSAYNDMPWEVLLNNVGPEVNSGKIPLSAFDYNQYSIGTKDAIDPEQITGIEIAPLSTGDEKVSATFSVSEIKTYGVEFAVSNAKAQSAMKNGLSIHSVTNNALKLNIADAGKYNVSVVTANGRLVQSFKGTDLAKGTNTLNLNTVATGVYFIKVEGISTKASLVKKTLVL